MARLYGRACLKSRVIHRVGLILRRFRAVRLGAALCRRANIIDSRERGLIQ